MIPACCMTAWLTGGSKEVCAAAGRGRGMGEEAIPMPHMGICPGMGTGKLRDSGMKWVVHWDRCHFSIWVKSASAVGRWWEMMGETGWAATN